MVKKIKCGNGNLGDLVCVQTCLSKIGQQNRKQTSTANANKHNCVRYTL